MEIVNKQPDYNESYVMACPALWSHVIFVLVLSFAGRCADCCVVLVSSVDCRIIDCDATMAVLPYQFMQHF